MYCKWLIYVVNEDLYIYTVFKNVENLKMYIEYKCVLFSSRIDTIFGEKTIDIYI